MNVDVEKIIREYGKFDGEKGTKYQLPWSKQQ